MCGAAWQDAWRRRSDMDPTMLSGAQRHGQILQRLCAVHLSCSDVTSLDLLGVLRHVLANWCCKVPCHLSIAWLVLGIAGIHQKRI